MSSLQVLLLASGETGKLGPLTETIPSPMIPILNQPVMTYPLERLARYGFKNILVSLYSFGGSVEAYFGTGSRWGVELDYVLQREPRGSAGVLKLASTRLRDLFLVVPGDAIVDFDIQALLDDHCLRGSIATTVVTDKNLGDDRQLSVNDQGYVNSLQTLSAKEVMYDTGVYIFDPEIFSFIPPRINFDIHKDLIPALIQNSRPVSAFSTRGYCNVLESFQDYEQAQQAFLLRSSKNGVDGYHPHKLPQYSLVKGQGQFEGILGSRNSSIHPAAHLVPPVYIGHSSSIGKGVELGPHVVIGSNVVIDDDATIRNSTILDNTYIGRFLRVENRVVNQNLVIDTPTGSSVCIGDDFLLSDVPAKISDSGLKRLFDFSLAFILLAITFPLSLLLALLTWLSTGRVFNPISVPAGVRFENITDEKPIQPTFQLLRFATRNVRGLPTKLGSLQEKFEWHRLPELWNVIRGDLNLVGVKPLSLDDVSSATEAWQRKRNDCKPGLTGLWYIQTTRNSEIDEILITDVYYSVIQNWQEDLRILLRTPQVWWHKVWH